MTRLLAFLLVSPLALGSLLIDAQSGGGDFIAEVRDGGNRCTGVRFQTKYILTSDHCVPPKNNVVVVELGAEMKKMMVLDEDQDLHLAVVCSPTQGPGPLLSKMGVTLKQELQIVLHAKPHESFVTLVQDGTFGAKPVGNAPCGGDSGGPALHNGQIVGVLERANCGGYATYYATTTPAAQSFIAQAIKNGSCQ